MITGDEKCNKDNKKQKKKKKRMIEEEKKFNSKQNLTKN